MTTEQRGAVSVLGTIILSAEPIPDPGRWPGVSRCGPCCGLLLTPRNLAARIRQCPAGIRPQEVRTRGERVWHGTWTDVENMRRTLALACVLAVMLVATVAVEPVAAQPNMTGQWSILPYTMPINPIHVGLMRTGRILVVSGSSNDPTVTTNTAAVYDPNTGVINVQTVPWDLFCNGLSFMPDGRALIAGGNVGYDPNRGIMTTTVFDPITERFIQVQDMARGRWYPSVVGLADGRMATFSGWLEGGGTNNAVEIYTNPNGWSQEYYAPFVPELYPWLHLLPDGRLFMSGSNVSSSIFNPSTNTGQTGVAAMKYSRDRIDGSSRLLPLSA